MRVFLVGFLLALAPLQAGLIAQTEPAEPPTQQFFSPSESPHRTRTRATIETAPAQNGRWDLLPTVMPINPVHAALMHTGKVLIVSGSGNDPDNKDFMAGVWDPTTQVIRTFRITWDMFCNGMVILPDGRPFVFGGTLRYDPFLGEPRASAFDPATETFTDLPNMSGGRWYPTGTVLGDGSVLVYSGLNDTNGGLNRTVEIWTGARKDPWIPAGTAFPSLEFYPREHLLPDGKVFESGWNIESQLYDPTRHTFTAVARTRLNQRRIYGTSVLLPLTLAENYKPRVMILGGFPGLPNQIPAATNTTELIDLSVPSPQWVNGPPMTEARVQLNATLLPDGKVLVSGGSQVDEDNASAVKAAELYDPKSNTFSPASTMEVPRLYHSNTLLLPDATVVAVGGNPMRKVYQPEIEVYSPPYLFDEHGNPARRPVITHVPAGEIHYGASFRVSTPDADGIRSVVLMRPGAATHAFDMEQRLVELSFTMDSGRSYLRVEAPATGNLAPPGYYLLFILDEKGVPSVAKFVHLTPGKQGKVHRKKHHSGY